MFKRILKWSGLGLLVVILLAGALAVNVIWFKPVGINLFFERAFIQFGLNSPQALTVVGIFDRLPVKFYQGKLDEVSVARNEELADWVEDTLHTLRRYNREKLDGQKALSYEIFEEFLDAQVDGRRWMWHGFPVNQISGIHADLPDFMLELHPVRNERDVDFYLERLEQFPQAFSGMVEVLSEGERRGVVAPRLAVEKALESMRGFRAHGPRENPLYTGLMAKVDGLEDFPAGRLRDLESVLEQVIRDSVYPAYDELIAYHEHLMEQPLSNDGVWRLPDGEDFYAWKIRSNTTTDYSADYIHQVGLSEVARIEAEMDAILCGEGYCDGSVGERMTALNEEERFLFPDTDAGREAIITAFQDIIDEVSAGLDDWFDVRPAAPVEVRPVPAYKEEGSAGAYYMPPAMDGSRPGVFYAKLQHVEDHPRYGLRTLAYHEAVPGHHFQLALQQEIRGVPMFRKLVPFTAYGEGWALYAERVAWEAGFQDDPFDNLGRLQAEMFRAVRLVVDTGMHHKRWSRERAIDYMLEKTGLAETDVVAEIERYLVWPGQALAYKVGMLKILELREMAETALGDDFDIRKFHNVVLMNGSMPLSVLETVVEDWVAEARG